MAAPMRHAVFILTPLVKLGLADLSGRGLGVGAPPQSAGVRATLCFFDWVRH